MDMYYPQRYNPRVSPGFREWHFLVLLVVAGAAFGYALSCLLGGPSSDEGFHAPQIWHYYNGGTDYAGNLTVPPTYHYAIAFVVRQIGYYHDYLLRFIQMSVALCVLPIFYAIAKHYYPQTAGVRMLQLFFAPLMFPFFFLLYTDLWALLFITLSWYGVLKRFYWLSALAGLLAVSIRQDAVIWVGLVYLLMCFDGISLRQRADYRDFIIRALGKGLPFLLLFLAFIVFVIVNGGVAIGDKQAHTIDSYNVTNVYVFLLCSWLLFLPVSLYQLPAIVAVLRRPWVWLLLVGGFVLFMGTFSNPHGYNNTMYSFFLHNGLLYLMMHSRLGLALFYLPIAWMALTLCTLKLPEKRYYWMLLIIPVSAIMHPLIEP
ncbi:MAG TPA: hypothetical protein VIC08_13115, partial [Cellvibrionaceae bacterium]